MSSTQLKRQQARREERILDRELDAHLDLLLSAKTVGPHAREKLKPLLRYYAKKPHPFTSCVRDNTKRFGPGRVDEVCATLKDIIVGNTHWRKGGGHSHLSQSFSDDALDYLLELSDGDVHEILLDAQGFYDVIALARNQNNPTPAPAGSADPGQGNGKTPADPQDADYQGDAGADAAPGDADNTPTGNEPPASSNYRDAPDPQHSCGACIFYSPSPDAPNDEDGTCSFYDADVEADYTCDKFQPQEPDSDDPFGSTTDTGTDRPGELDFIHDDGELVLAEFYLDDEGLELDQKEKGIWKTILKTGTWKLRPGPGQRPVAKPLTVVESGDPGPGNLSIDELVMAFEDGAVEHVTVPKSHENNVDENTGFVTKLRKVKDGAVVKLQGLIDFRDPDVERGALQGTIANTSVGAMFNFKRKSDGKLYKQALGHVALTNQPWIDGMEPFGVNASQEASGEPETLVFTYEQGEEVNMGTENEDGTAVVLDLSDPRIVALGLSTEEMIDRLSRMDAQESRLRAREVEATVKDWQTDGVPPAVLAVVKPIMLSDDGGAALLLSQEDGSEKTLSATEIVSQIVAVVPRLDLSDKVNDKDGAVDPKDNADGEVKLSREVRSKAAELQMEDLNLSDEDAISRAKRELKIEDAE